MSDGKTTATGEALQRAAAATINDREAAVALEVQLSAIATALASDNYVPRGLDFLTAVAMLAQSRGLEQSTLETAMTLENDLAEVHYSTDREAKAFLKSIQNAYTVVITGLQKWHAKQPSP